MDGNQGRKQKRNKRKRKARTSEDRGDHGRKHSTDGLVEAGEAATASHPWREAAADELEPRSDSKVGAGGGDASSLVAVGRADAAKPTGSANASVTGGKKGKKRRRQEAAASLAATASKAESKPRPTGDGDAAQSRKAKKTQGGRGITNNSSRATAAAVTAVVLTEQTVGGGRLSPPEGPSGGRSGGVSGGARKGKGGAAGRGSPPLSDLQKRMRQKLEGAQFRMINEELYTSESGASLAKFEREPELFDVYHRGFREQVEKWPSHPLDVIIDWLGKYPKARVADFGCGEARLAATVPNKVHSFDLVSPNQYVTACDMANVPLKDASVHVAVFCLSLMGTNLADFLREAHRVLVPGGLVKVAEVRSRFEGEEGGVERFLEVTKRLGFDCRQMDRTNKMFLMAEFKKSKRKPENGVDFEAKACIYKRR